MPIFGNSDKARAEELDAIRKLSEQAARLEGQVADLIRQKDLTAELRKAEDKLETTKREQARKDEEHDRKVRETEHRVGLLKLQQEHDVANAKRETMVTVREENLDKDRQRFEGEMKFQREHFERQANDIKSILSQVLERLPEWKFSRTESETTRPPKPRAEARG